MTDSSDDDHPYVKFGTALAETDEVNPGRQKPVALHDQIVTDDSGRRRFHGAFTGGFSAGYYNSVGSKDGWTPSNFTSSRQNKYQRSKARPEDFMDEEDKSDFGIAPQKIAPTQAFSNSAKRVYQDKKQVSRHESSSNFLLGSEIMDTLVVPTRTNIGIKLLRKMGWKEGQGIGPRIDSTIPGRSTSSNLQSNLPSEKFFKSKFHDGSTETVTFAPRDTMPIDVSAKENLHGLGYRGIDPKSAINGGKKISKAVKAWTKSGKGISFRGQAFGVGAYEDDDDDIYGIESMESYDRVMGGEANPDTTYGWTKPLALTGGSKKEALTDGLNNLMDSFTIATKNKIIHRKCYRAPKIPPNFDPNKRLKLQESRRKASSAQRQRNPDMVKPNEPTQYSATDRRAMLEGGSVSAKPMQNIKSVFDLISTEDREKMEQAKTKSNDGWTPTQLGAKIEMELKAARLKSDEEEKKPLVNFQSLKLFTNNPEKQRRYEDYQRAVRQRKKDPYSTIVSTLTEWERNHEMLEFGRVSQVYSKLSTNINNRFTKGSESDDKLRSDKESAAKTRVFGVMTRSTIDWHPDSLLCKRFNVPNPYPDSDTVGLMKNENRTILSLTNLEVDNSTTPSQESYLSAVTPENKDVTKKPGRWDVEPKVCGPNNREETDQSNKNQNTAASSEESQKSSSEVASAEQPPTMDLFKSIFGNSSSEDNDSSDEEETKDSSEVTPSGVSDRTSSTSAASVFQRPMSTYENKLQQETEKRADAISADSHCPNNDVFGPPLPPPTCTSINNSRAIVISSSDENDDRQVKKKASKHKKKKKKHDKKKKHKKKDRQER